MNDLSYSDKQLIEELLLMSGGYVLKFSDSTFSDFFSSVAKINIDDEKYQEYGGSKAKRMRSFLKQADNATVSLVLSELLKLVPLQNPDYSPEILKQITETTKNLNKKSKPKLQQAEHEKIWADDKVKYLSLIEIPQKKKLMP